MRIRDNIRVILQTEGNNIVDHLIKSMERQTAVLESDISEKVRQFLEEKRKSDELLSQLLPKSIATVLLKGQMIMPEKFGSTTVMFSKVGGFDEIIQQVERPSDTLSLLNNLYTVTDAIIDQYDVYKVETLNDSLMVK